MISEPTKTCRTCGVKKEAAAFSRRRAVCVACICEVRRAKYAADPTPQIEAAKAWARANKARKAAVGKAWHAANREKGRDASLRSKYGITLGMYEGLHATQAGVCAVCRKPRKLRLVVDHCHAGGGVRGLLCGGCNTGLGKLGDTIEGLQRAIFYLETAKTLVIPEEHHST